MKDTIYFQHDYDAHTDPKMIKLRINKGWEGYGLFWACLEVMRSDTDIVIKESDIDAIAFRLHYECKALVDFLHFCVSIGLFSYDGKDKLFFSKRLQENVEYMRAKSKKARKSANARWKPRSNANALQTQSEGNAIKERKVNEKIGNDIDTSTPKLKRGKFSPPTIEQVKQYFQEKGYCEAAAKKAWEYYDVAGWKDRDGKQVQNRKQKMIAVWFKDENKAKAPVKQLSQEEVEERTAGRVYR